MTNRQNILSANRDGLQDHNTDSWQSYYTPILRVAYNLGRKGIDLSNCVDFTGHRYGYAPESGISYNYANQSAECGLSLAVKTDGTEVGSVIWFTDRKKHNYTGLLLPILGSDDEAMILPYGFTVND